MRGVKEAAKDPFTWYFCLIHFALTTAQSSKDFLASVSDFPKNKAICGHPVG
jgi:hypothetical protein